MNYTALGGETLCEVAINNGFPDCQKLRDANPKLKDVESLVAGTEVTIPDKKQNIFSKALDAIYKYKRRNFPPPTVEFIKEGLGKGYAAVPAPDEDTTLASEDMAVTNYVSDRGGDGLIAGNFPADTVFRDDPLGSADPDHFKIQVYDNGAKVNEVKVDLFALKPAYYKEVVDGVAYVRHHPTKYTRPDAAKRKLENIVCRRIGSTNYFRSPYLRLVSTEASRAKRPTQCLLLADYWDEGPKSCQKYYTEILHQKAQARYKLRDCPVAKCAALREVDLESDKSLHLAFHIVKGCGITPKDIQTTVYKWCRAALAPAHLRPIVDRIETVDIPQNMICVANLTQARRGFHASGKKGLFPNPSVMSFTVDGVQLFHSPTAGDSPETTADNIISKITAAPALAGYTCKKIRHRRSDVTSVASKVSDPFDILVFKQDGSLAVVTNVTSNDWPVGGIGGQSLSRVMNFTLNNFPVDWEPASPEQRILRWNYYTDGAMNMYIVGTPLQPIWPQGVPLDGFSPYGPYAGWVADVGPIVYLSKTGVTRAFVILHEMCHPMMHNGHTAAPMNDAGTQTVELMDGAILTEDQYDATKHIADAPIKAKYELVEENGAVLVDGKAATPAPRNTVTTPVLRLHTVATFYGMLQEGDDPVLDPGVADLPARPEDA
jgi:hypothetical protein